MTRLTGNHVRNEIYIDMSNAFQFCVKDTQCSFSSFMASSLYALAGPRIGE